LAAFTIVMVICRIVSLSSILATLMAIGPMIGLEQPLPYRLLIGAGGMLDT
jgi:glycerol-3-phosphate acyltransferase PlsY